MLLHLLPNDHKFIDYVVEYFEAAKPGQNRFTVWGEKSDELIQNADRLTWIPARDASQEAVLHHPYSGIVTHGLDLRRALFLNQLDRSIPVAWLVFGQEYYSIIRGVRDSLYEPQTSALNKSLAWKRAPLRYVLKQSLLPFRGSRCHDLVSQWMNGHASQEQVFQKAFERADFVGCPFIEEFEYIQSKFQLTSEPVDFCYYNLEDTASGCLQETVYGNNVLVGNSSSLSNNHLEVLSFLANHREHFGQVSVPLGYGQADYRTAIVSQGQSKLGKQFDPWTEFIDRSEFVNRALKCKVAIMNHRRQQGVGTVLTLLWIGSKLFLNPESTIYSFLKRFGVSVYSVQDLLENKLESPFEELSADAMENNRTLLRQHFNKERVVEYTTRLVDRLDQLASKNELAEMVPS